MIGWIVILFFQEDTWILPYFAAIENSAWKNIFGELYKAQCGQNCAVRRQMDKLCGQKTDGYGQEGFDRLK